MRSIFLLFMICAASVYGQQGRVLGDVRDELTNEPIAFSTVYVQGTDIGTVTDSLGNFELQLKPGLYNLEVSFLGYETAVLYSIPVSTAQAQHIHTTLVSTLLDLPRFEVQANAGRVSPIYSDKISAFEVVSMPGATMDLSKFLKVLPGVSPKVSFGYSMIVRGGASNENRFFLDDIEIPSITHFAVQGNNGGPNGILNTRILQSAELFTDGMPINRGNALSSVLEVESRLGNKEKFSGNFTLGATDWGFVLEGPMGKKSSYVFSARESFSQHMLKALGIPVVPFYADVHYAQKIRFNAKTELKLLGIGTYDKYTLNLDAEKNPGLVYNIGYIPEGKQLSFTTGAALKRFHDTGYSTFVLSRSYFENRADKFYDNTYEEADRMMEYRSIEASTKFRYERRFVLGKRRIDYGVEATNESLFTHNHSPALDSTLQVITKDYSSDFDYQRFGLFYNTEFVLGGKQDWILNVGLRSDMATYNDRMKNPLRQIAPRIGLKYLLNDQVDWNINLGRYTQLPAHVLMSYMEDDVLVNQPHLDYIKSDQISTGINFSNYNNLQSRFSIFYKSYSDYPMLHFDGISFANANANYVLVGDQPANSDSRGHAYGAELMVKKKYTGGWSFLYSGSYVVSKFTNLDGVLHASAWDNRIFSTINLSKRFKNNWTIAAKWSIAGGNPYTPYNWAFSAEQTNWQMFRRGIPDYSRLNEDRLPVFHQLDFRIDKQFNFRNWAFTFYIDVQNAYKADINQIPYLTAVYDESDWTPMVDPANPSSYLLDLIASDSGRMLPTVGLFFDF